MHGFPNWLATTISWLAPVCGTLFFASQSPTLFKAFLRRSVGPLTPVPIALIYGNCLYWLLYGVLINDISVAAPNIIGLVMALLYIPFFSYACSDSKRVIIMLTLVFIFSAMLGIIYVIYFFTKINMKPVISVIATTLAIATFASPLTDIYRIIKHRSCASITFSSCIFGFIVTSLWVTYAFAKEDPSIDYSIFIANLPGAAFNLIQIILFAIFWRNTKREWAEIASQKSAFIVDNGDEKHGEDEDTPL